MNCKECNDTGRITDNKAHYIPPDQILFVDRQTGQLTGYECLACKEKKAQGGENQ